MKEIIMLGILSNTFRIASRTDDLNPKDYHELRRDYLEMESRRKNHVRRRQALTKYFHQL